MEQLKSDIEQIIKLAGFEDFSINFDDKNSRFAVFISDHQMSPRWLPNFVVNLDYLIRLMAMKRGATQSFSIDVNNYRREREVLIIELAKGAAKKAATTKQEISLPAMNAYERRLIHMELANHPDLKTESVGEGKGRYVIIRLIENS